MPAATATADPPLDPPGMRSGAQGLRVGPNAEFSVDEPIANSSQLVLPTMTAPAASSRATTVASYGGTNVSSMRDEAVVRTPRVQRLSFSATGTPTSGRSHPARAVAIDVRGALQRACGGDGVEGVQRGIERPDARERLLADLDRRAIAAANRLAHLSNRGRVGHPMTLGTLNRPASGALSGAFASAAARSSDGVHDVRAIGRVTRPDACGRRHAGRVDALHLVRVVEDVAELTREQIELGFLQLEVGQSGDGFHVGSSESSGHGKC